MQDHLVANRTYAWRNDGLLNTITQGNTRRDFGYDSIGRLASDTLKVAASNVTLNGVTYGYDNDDNVTSKVVTAAGNPAAGSNTYTYDTAGRLATWTNPASVLTTYGYDNAGNRTTAGAQTFTYDERNRLTSGTGLTNVWSARGSLTSSTVSGVATTYTADGLNRVTGVTRGATSLGFSYDSLDRPWQRTSNATVTNEFSYAGGETDPVMTATAGGAQKSVYGRSPAGMLLSGGIIGGVKASVGTDRHGDTTHYFDPTAATVTGTGLFDPYGKPAGTSGTVFPELGVGYQSDWTDPLTGDVNMGARWYDPNTAVFRTRDTVFGMLGTPVTLNRYTYGNANPMKYWDPTGREGEIFFGDFFSYADMIALMPQYAPPPPQEPVTETFASGTGAWTTITTDQWGQSTFVVTAATGVTVSAPSTTERSGNLSYTPTESAHVATVVLAESGYGASAIAQAINDTVAVVGATPSTEQIIDTAITPPVLVDSVPALQFFFNAGSESARVDSKTQVISKELAVPIVKGVGRIKLDFFISAAMAGAEIGSCYLVVCASIEPRGNGRTFNPSASLSASKAQLSLDFSTGVATVGVNETCWTSAVKTPLGTAGEKDSCYRARPLGVSVNGQFSGSSGGGNSVKIDTTRQQDGFDVTIQYSLGLAGPMPRWAAPTIDGSITISTRSTGNTICRNRDNFPSLGAYRTLGGKTRVLFEEGESGIGPVALTGLGGSDTGCRTF